MAGIGSTLREARMRAHLDIVDFESRTKIRAKYLRALEDEEWGLLPGYTFTKGFLRTYADMLGLDGRALVDEFKRQYRDPSETDPPPLPAGRRDARRPREHAGERSPRRRPPPASGRPPIAVAIVVLVVLLAAALYAVGVLLPRNSHPPRSSTHTTTTTSTSTTATTAPRGLLAPTKVGLELEPTANVYVCLVGYPGSSDRHPHIRVNSAIITPGQREPVYHDNHFRIRLGNGSLAMVVDGHRHMLAGPDPLTYLVTVHGAVDPIAAADAPHCT